MYVIQQPYYKSYHKKTRTAEPFTVWPCWLSHKYTVDSTVNKHSSCHWVAFSCPFPFFFFFPIANLVRYMCINSSILCVLLFCVILPSEMWCWPFFFLFFDIRHASISVHWMPLLLRSSPWASLAGVGLRLL
jgi:hypothetical protein